MSQIASTTTKLEGTYDDVLFDRSEFSHGTITGTYINCSFVRADFRYTIASNAIFKKCDFRLIDGNYSVWNNCTFDNCKLEGAKFKRAEFNGCKIITTDIIPPMTIFDKFTTITDCKLSELTVCYKKNELNNLHDSVRKYVISAINSTFDIILTFVRAELKSDKAHDLMIKLLTCVRLEHKSQTKEVENYVWYAKNNPEMLRDELLSNLTRAYKSALLLVYNFENDVLQYASDRIPSYVHNSATTYAENYYVKIADSFT